MSLDNHDLTTDFIDTTQDDVQQRYVELVVKQRERKTQHEFAITKVGPYATDSFSFFSWGKSLHSSVPRCWKKHDKRK